MTSRACGPSRSTRERMRRSKTSGTSVPALPLRRQVVSSLYQGAGLDQSRRAVPPRTAGCPRRPAHMASMTPSPAPGPMRERARARSASSGKGESSTLRNGLAGTSR